MTGDLVAFLNARLDEDARTARDCAGDGRWDSRDIAIYAEDLAPEVREHMARHDPARVFADVEAKREVVRLAERAHDYAPTFTSGFSAAMEHALRLFAAAYADHRDYREEWKP